MKRVCIFAHWDKDNFIDDYVIYYLKSLKNLCEKIVFVSDCSELKNKDILDDIVDFSIIENHHEYDFGSYKRGFLLAQEQIPDYDELLFVNDTCYGPFFELETIFKKMEKKKCDFWGLTRNNYGLKKDVQTPPEWLPHIQSYFLVFKKNVCNSEVFLNFINNIKHEETKDEIIKKYEIGLSRILIASGFKPAVYINKYSHTGNCLNQKWERLIRWYKFPFLKTNIPKNGIPPIGEIKNWKPAIESVSDYPTELISKNVDRLKDFAQNKYVTLNPYRKLRFHFLNNTPMEFRPLLIKFEKNTFNILNTLCFHKLPKF